MKLALTSFSYHLRFGRHWFRPEQPCELQWYCERSAALGLDGLHIDPWHVNIDNDIDWLVEFGEQKHMYLELGWAGVSAEAMLLGIDVASRLGSPLIRTFVGGPCTADRIATSRRASEAKEQISRSLDFAEKSGVRIALENHQDMFLEDFLNILELDSPYLGVCYDNGNFAAMGEDPVAALHALAGRVFSCHLKDVLPAEKFPDAVPFGLERVHFGALGEGNAPLKTIVDTMKGVQGDDARITLNIHTPFHRNLEEKALLKCEEDNVEKSVTYARKVLKIK